MWLEEVAGRKRLIWKQRITKWTNIAKVATIPSSVATVKLYTHGSIMEKQKTLHTVN